jgi:hypothetical protein
VTARAGPPATFSRLALLSRQAQKRRRGLGMEIAHADGREVDDDHEQDKGRLHGERCES